MRTLWIGLREEDFLCGHEMGRETIQRMNGGGLVRFGASALQAIRTGGSVIGYGLVVSLHRSDSPVPIDSDRLQPMVERVRRALGMRGIGGSFTINLEEADPPVLPTPIA